MSLFKTVLQVDLKPFYDALPPRSHVHSVTFDANKREVNIVWENEGLRTGLSVPTDYSIAALVAKQVGLPDTSMTPKPARRKKPVDETVAKE